MQRPRAGKAVSRTAGAIGQGVLLLMDYLENVLPSAVRNVPCVEVGGEMRVVMDPATRSVVEQARSVGSWWKNECSVRGEGWGGADPKQVVVGLRRQGRLPNLMGRSFVQFVLVLVVLAVVSTGKVAVAAAVVAGGRLAGGVLPLPVAVIPPVVSQKASSRKEH